MPIHSSNHSIPASGLHSISADKQRRKYTATKNSIEETDEYTDLTLPEIRTQERSFSNLEKHEPIYKNRRPRKLQGRSDLINEAPDYEEHTPVIDSLRDSRNVTNNR